MVWYNGEKGGGSRRKGAAGNEIYSMVATKNAGIWIATDLGVQELHFDKGKKKVLKPSVAASLPDDVVTSIYPSKSGQNLGLGTFKSGVWDVDVLTIKADTDAELLLMDVPMN